jgi:ketosteroid isomerase-like protein
VLVDNAEVALRILDAWNRRDRAQFELMTPDFEFVNRPDAVDPGTRHGHDGVREAARSMRRAFEDYSFEVEEVLERGDRVVTIVRFVAQGRALGTELVRQLGFVWTVRDGKALRVEVFGDRESALAAAGIRDG